MSTATTAPTSTTTMRDRAAARWRTLKPIGLGVVDGLIAGPIISGALGFQTRTSTAQAAARTGIVEQQALFCEERARAALPADSGRVDWSRAYDLARRWAAMPGSAGGPLDSEVQQACAPASCKLSS